MTGKPGIRSVFEAASGDFVIRAMMSMDYSDWKAVVFDRSRIELLVEDGAKDSKILLLSGKIIPVRMPLGELEQKIFRPSFKDGSVLDLSTMTGPVKPLIIVEEVKVEKPPEVKKEVAPPVQKIVPGEFCTTFLARRTHDQEVTSFTVRNADVAFGSALGFTGKNGPALEIPLRNGVKTPFGQSYILIDMAHDEFNRRTEKSAKNKIKHLDLTRSENLDGKPGTLRLIFNIRRLGTPDAKKVSVDSSRIDWETTEVENMLLKNSGPRVLFKDGYDPFYKNTPRGEILLQDIDYSTFRDGFLRAQKEGYRELDYTKPRPWSAPVVPIIMPGGYTA
jgi:hypothetical protein